MIKFARLYNKQWSRSWVMFFIAMWIILLRRGIAIVWGAGVDGEFLKILSWVDYIGVATACTFLYLAFLYMNWNWWKGFWKEMKDHEEEVEIRHIEMDAPNCVEVDDPKKVIVGLDDKKVIVENPKKVRVESPKKFKVVKVGNKKPKGKAKK